MVLYGIAATMIVIPIVFRAYLSTMREGVQVFQPSFHCDAQVDHYALPPKDVVHRIYRDVCATAFV